MFSGFPHGTLNFLIWSYFYVLNIVWSGLDKNRMRAKLSGSIISFELVQSEDCFSWRHSCVLLFLKSFCVREKQDSLASTFGKNPK